MKAFIPAFLALAFAGHAAASSPQAWAALDKQVTRACLSVSELKEAKAVGKTAQFDDRVGYVALLLEGRYPQAHMNNQKGTELCLFDKKRKAAFVTEWTPGPALKGR